ncbi:oligoribonuclease [Luteimicrobium subarcticum]|uniref:Oligoribonuclease n=1 Tax=Luteimicrobium subarcticum TaxID=620910 RepID=A0A2M8WUA9_9MICO|nr:oligoribonuclease [Luteimicrobium subarcticum]PJI94513.1 oligoribonuclease [Luteimicrobium subarcticum]
MTTSPATDRIVWIDCEMTGLSLEHDALVEVAAVVTDSELNVLGDGVDVLIKPPQEALDQMNDFVRTMHTTSGLLEELAHGTTLADAQQQVLDYVRTWVPDAKKAPLAGNSVGTDKTFLDRDMTELVEHLHYRIIDVSSIKELARRWYPRVYFQSPEKHGGHRALADILESIDELRYYREVLFVPQPGPDSKSAKAVADKVLASPSRAGDAPA